MKNQDNKQIISLPKTDIPLWRWFPALQRTIPHVQLADLPTPITQLNNLSKYIGIPHVYMKRDDLTGTMQTNGFRQFGGNKVRKLEFLLAEAVQYSARSVITFGNAGSNHALATAVYSQRVGLKSILILKPQWNSPVVQRNLLLDYAAGARMYLCLDNMIRSFVTLHTFFMHKQKYGSYPYIVPVGGSCPLGALGYVNAALELKEQIIQQVMPEPTRIYVPVGSVGTIVGLLIGTKIAGLRSKIVGVTVEPEKYRGEFLENIKKLFSKTNDFLCEHDVHFPRLSFDIDDFSIQTEFCGEDYGLSTKEGREALELLKNTEHITLDGTYSAKAFAAFLHDASQCKNNEVLLFWNTFSTDAIEIPSISYTNLPIAFHEYFEKR